MRVLLVKPFFQMFPAELPVLVNEPLGLEYLASVTRKEHDILIYDCIAEGYKSYKKIISGDMQLIQIGTDIISIKKKIKTFNPDVVGVTASFFSQMPSTLSITKAVKDIDNSIITLMGGPYPSSYEEKTLKKDPNLDIMAYGEGEMTFKHLLDNKFENLEKIRGIMYRKKNKIVRNKPQNIITNLDEIPFPSRDMVPLKVYSRFLGPKKRFILKAVDNLIDFPVFGDFILKYYGDYIYSKSKGPRFPISSMITSRSCPNRCTFCAIHNVWGMRYRMRSAENVLNEMEMLSNEYNIREISILDDNFTVSKKRAIDICKGIKERKLDMTFQLPSGVYIPTLDRELLTWLKRAGLTKIYFGIESGNQKILDKVVRKRIDLKQTKKIIKLSKEVGLETNAFFILGMPGETKKTMLDTIKFAYKSKLDNARFHIYQPFPGTYLYDYALKRGYITKEFSLDKLRVRTPVPVIKTKDFTPNDVLDMKKIAKDMFSKKVQST